ncbi:MAG: GNAT family N-acetyltransferase [Candidatus Aminicenantes bacterium]|nr:GNAT family N-acetyltransferase [Candidatus Aminicenantes bacterium]
MTIENISIEPFRGDYKALERMAHASWRDEYGEASFPNFYKPAFLRYLFDRVKDRDHLLAAYRGDEIVGFLANLPQRFHYQGRIYRAVYSCLLVSRKEFLRRGLATALIEEALRVNRKHRYDFALLTLEAGHRSTKLMKKMEAAGRPLEWIKKIRVIARILDLERVARSEGLKSWEKAAVRLIGGHRPPKPAGASVLRPYRPGDLDSCLALLNRIKDTVRLALVWEAGELSVELNCPGVSQTLVYEKEGQVSGLVNFIQHDHLGRTVEKWAWLNHVAYPDLTPSERRLFVRDFLRFIHGEGFLGAIEWTKNYYSLKPLYRARFFPYFRAVNLMSWKLEAPFSLRNIPDVYEIQV